MKRTIPLVIAVGVAVAGCSQMTTTTYKAPMKDGEVAVPANYKSFPTMLTNVQRPDAKQVRDMYIDPKGATAKAGEAFPYGTIMVMENYSAKIKADGSLETGPDGKLVKDKMVRIFVMEKAKGAGADVPDALKNGEWVYSSYTPDGVKTEDNLMACRGCHLTIAVSKDFVHRYDEYFQRRAAQ